MNDDLVRRLRCYADLNDAVFDPWIYGEAADRIERLEAALRDIRAMHYEGGIDDLQERDDRTYFMICDVLEGKDD